MSIVLGIITALGLVYLAGCIGVLCLCALGFVANKVSEHPSLLLIPVVLAVLSMYHLTQI